MVKEVRVIMEDGVHSKVKQYATEHDLKLGEAIEQLLVIGMDYLEKKKKKGSE
jgi:hypothetical protein